MTRVLVAIPAPRRAAPGTIPDRVETGTILGGPTQTPFGSTWTVRLDDGSVRTCRGRDLDAAPPLEN